jgi:succinoglycan biosynthesis transport protein ExoP
MSLSPDFPGRRPGTDLADHLSLVRRRWLLFLGFLLVGGTAGLGLLRFTPAAYTATTQVLVAPVGVQDQSNQVTNRQREPLNLDTEAQIAQSSVVADKAAKELKTSTPEPVEVSVPPNSAVLWISVTAADPAVAAAQSRAYAQAYLANRTESAQATMTAQQKAMLVKLKQVNTALDAVIKELALAGKGTIQHTIAAHRQSVLNRQAYSLTLKYDALRTVAITPGSVISQATPPTVPSSPSLPLYLGTGLMIGLLLGTATAYARDQLDTRLRTAADVERLTGLPVLGDLSDPLRQGVPYDLASAVIAACPGKRLLVRAIPAELGAAPVVAPLAGTAPLSLLTGSDVGDLARADAALLLVGLRRATSTQVAAAVRHLGRHNVPIIGVVTTTDLTPRAEPVDGNPLGKLVASGGLEPGRSAESAPMTSLPRPPGTSA